MDYTVLAGRRRGRDLRKRPVPCPAVLGRKDFGGVFMILERKIGYLDYFERGEKIKGCGFLKLEKRGNAFRLEMNVRGLHPTDSFARDVVVVSEDTEKNLGQILLEEGNGCFRTSFAVSGFSDRPDAGDTPIRAVRVLLGGNREIRCAFGVKPVTVTGIPAETPAARTPQTMESRTTESRTTEPGEEKIQATEPRTTESRTSESREEKVSATEPRTTESRTSESKEEKIPATEPRTMKSRTSESREEKIQATEPRTTEPRALESQEEKPRATESRTTESRTSESREEKVSATEPRTTESRTSESKEEKIPATEPRTTEPRALESQEEKSRATESREQSSNIPGETETAEDRQSADKVEPEKNGSIRETVSGSEWETDVQGRIAGHGVESREQAPKNGEVMSADIKERPKKPIRIHEDKWGQLAAIYPHVRPFNDEREYLSLSPSDFVLFPSKYYRAANNSFLLHGYYNYRHLVLARLEQRGEARYYLGVPGNFYDREKQVAVMFGFESFECAMEPAKTGDFGYYMMKVEL